MLYCIVLYCIRVARYHMVCMGVTFIDTQEKTFIFYMHNLFDHVCSLHHCVQSTWMAHTIAHANIFDDQPFTCFTCLRHIMYKRKQLINNLRLWPSLMKCLRLARHLDTHTIDLLDGMYWTRMWRSAALSNNKCCDISSVLRAWIITQRSIKSNVSALQ